MTAVPLIAAYDGFFGPGTGSFFMLAFVMLAGFGVLKATAHTKMLNFASNIGSLIVFIPSVGNFIVPDVLGGAKGLMVGNLVEQQFLSSRNWPFGSALSMIIMAVVLTVLMVSVTRARKAGGHA